MIETVCLVDRNLSLVFYVCSSRLDMYRLYIGVSDARISYTPGLRELLLIQTDHLSTDWL